jgi:hypothetical protein
MAQTGFIDFRLNLNARAWAVLHMLDCEPDFAPYDEETGEYKIETETGAFYNGRERGFSIRVSLDHPTVEFLYVVFAENRSSDDIVVYCWKGSYMVNPPCSIPEEYYKSRQFLPSVESAVRYIRSLMRDHLARVHQEAQVEEVLES